ncbi:unnamed protein product [Rotaria sordida]|uniref:Uncharacterized protein n=1 Tax=Rotaria sordida TaxID=392033 RepID=A0A815H3Q6_9BILA|nr:unnamed protein product [Rotaria sordida]CAF1346361.1 unnamed protein product [Rotaria sordida]CAF3729925.1 unnamed protein product [Rotaria sordida]CAF3851600.1 unnamed protein product [Rotaria sordida]
MKRKEQILLPDTIIDVYAVYPEAFYSNMKVLLKICTTLPMTTTYLRSTISEIKLIGLTVVYIYRDLDANVDSVIDEFGKSNR